MKIVRLSIIGVFFVVAATLSASLPVSAGQGFSGVSYFQGSNSNAFITAGSADPAGNSSGVGYVMPNRHDACGFGGWCPHAGGNGAVGWKALGYTSEAAANNAGDQDRKLRLYCFLENRNGRNTTRAACNSWSPNPASSTTDWEKMGSAVVVYQLLGQTGKNKGEAAKNISTADWDDLYGRLMNPNLRMRSTNSASNATNTSGIWANSKLDARDYYFDGGDVLTVPAWEFSNASDGSIKYRIEVSCANGLGGLGTDSYIIPSIKYSLTPTLTTPTTTPVGTTPNNGGAVGRGDKIIATARVVNSGVAAADKNWYISRLTYNSGSNPSNASARDSNSTGALCDEFNDNACSSQSFSDDFEADGSESGSMPEFTVPSTVSEGTKYCFVVSVRNPTEINNSPAWRHSALNCVTVQKEFSLTPSITDVLGNRPDNSVVEPGASGAIKHSVTNAGVDNSVSVDWRLTYFVYLPGSPIPSAADKQEKVLSDKVPCEAFPGTGLPAQRSVCTNNNPPGGWVSAPKKVFSGSSSALEEIQYKVPDDTAVGTKLCWVASVSPPTQSSPAASWRHSAMHCLVVSKKPKIQVWGGDVRSGSKIRTSTSVIDGSTFGSWVEYAALSMDVNTGFSSGSGLGGGNNQANVSSWNKLTFANTGTVANCTFGCFNFSLTGPTLTSQFAADSSAQQLSGTRNINDLNGTYTAQNLNITASTISKLSQDVGRTIIILATGTVKIEGDIVYNDGEDYSSPQAISQVIIRAPVINIENSAQRVDAWLLAVAANEKGTLNTCSTVYDAQNKLSADRCNNKLTINGPVVADILKLRRTSGSGVGTDELRAEPAEVFNLRADAYLWASVHSSKFGTSQIQTVYTTELSPRF